MAGALSCRRSIHPPETESDRANTSTEWFMAVEKRATRAACAGTEGLPAVVITGAVYRVRLEKA